MPAVLELMRAMWLESPNFNRKQFAEDKAINLLNFFVYSGQGGGFVAEKDDVLVGMIAGVVAEDLITVGRHVTDLAVYITPAERGGSILPRMVHMFEEWAFGKVEDVILGVSTGIETERTVYLYERLGYTMMCQALIKSKG